MLYVTFGGVDAAYWRIGEKGSGMLLIIHRTRDPLCSMKTRLPGGKVSLIGFVLLQSSLKVRPPSKQIYLGKFVTGKQELLGWKLGRR